MKTKILIISLILISFNLMAQDITGDWNGALKIGGMQLRLVFHITKTAGAGTNIAHDHESRRAFTKAFANIRAGGFFANSVQFLVTKNIFYLVEMTVQRRGLYANPLRFY